LHDNPLTSLPPEIGNLTIDELDLSRNQLASLPPEIGNLERLDELYLNGNQLTSLPSEIGNLTGLERLQAANNLLASIPPEIGNLASLTSLGLWDNQLTNIPPEIGNLTNLRGLSLHMNQLSRIPSEIMNLTGLKRLRLYRNQIAGSIPDEFLNLTNLESNESDFRWNALYSSNPELIAFLNSKQIGGDWQSTQTIAPENVTVGVPESMSIPLSWNAIPYTDETGGYEIYYSEISGDPYTYYQTTTDKNVENITVIGLTPFTRYYFILRTVTNSHSDNPNTVYSEYSDEVSAKTLDVDTDTDGDGTPDHEDGCDNDPNKIKPGTCGCSVSDTDADSDGTPDCNDSCETDPNKTEIGIRGCVVAEIDTDEYVTV